MYKFVDVNEASGSVVLPSEALQINGEYIEKLITGYRTLQVTGREALSAELLTYETGARDGSAVTSKRYPARYITVRYQLLAASPEAFRAAYNQLASILNVDEAQLIFNDEPDKYFIGTLETIGEVPGGTNSVVSEFTFFCADPFKYSVIEYEAEPGQDGFLIDYNGTYKAFPTLEAEFYGENESIAALTGNGDCGYVAFFNENEKIIQLGTAEEADTENYPKSQTLVNQNFNDELAWNTVAETNWATNNGKVVDGFQQSGNMAVTPAYYETTTAPSTSGTLLTKTSKMAKPYVDYNVTAQTSGRTADTVNVKVTITTTLSIATNAGASKATAGAKVTLPAGTKLYTSATATSNSSTKSGTYYLWSAEIVNGRIRITNSSSNVGKSGQVTGWVKTSDISIGSSAGLGKGYGLKGSIQISGGDWDSIIVKNESSTWNDNSSHVCSFTVKVRNLTATTTKLENIRFKVERTDNEEGKAGILDEVACKDLEISTYTAPVAGAYYLMPETYGTSSGWHGASVTRRIPADAAGTVGAENFTLTYHQKLSIGNSSSALQEMGAFQALLISGSGSSRKILAGVNIAKNADRKTANLDFYVNGKKVSTLIIDLSFNNPYFGNNSNSQGIITVKTSTITKTGKTVEFNIGGIKKTFNDSSITNTAATEITFMMSQYGTKPVLSYNGLYWAKFVKNNCDTYKDIPNKFSANDVVTADCKNGEIFLNGTLTPALGALGNDWEDFYLTPGLNLIGTSYSSWVSSYYAPAFKIRYREVFI